MRIHFEFDFWLWLCRFAYRRIAKTEPRMPVGIPGVRDPDAPCDSFSPRRKGWDDWGDCKTDGHYLCKECCHREKSEAP